MKPEEIRQLLPRIFQEAILPNTPISTLIEAMSLMHDTQEEIFSNLDKYFSPWASPEDFLPYLGSWFYLHQYYSLSEDGDRVDFQPGISRLRELLAGFARLSRFRGTSASLKEMLTLSTGQEGFIINDQVEDENGKKVAFHMVISVPESAKKFHGLIDLIIRNEKPAYVTYEMGYH